MIFSLEALPAREGDSLLLHWGTPAMPRLAVIDGGPRQTWETSLRPRLESMIAHRNTFPLSIDLVMVSHVDNDHIVGIKKLFAHVRSEVENGLPSGQRLFSVDRLWHNTFNDLLGDGIDGHYKSLIASIQARVGDAPNPRLEAELAEAYQWRYPDDIGEAEGAAHDMALILAGHGEGRQLRSDHDYLRTHHQIATLNSPFQRNGTSTLITAECSSKPLDFLGLEFQVVAPSEPEILKLQRAFDSYTQKHGFATTAAVLAAYSDRSIPNLSSIACIVTGGDRRILLTGDARGDKLLQGLKAAELLDSQGKLHVDILKVPHHGSSRNLKPEFFERVTADTYVFSGDGTHGNPERVTIKWLTEARGPAAAYTIVLTYPVADIDVRRQADAVKRCRPWVATQHSLASFFADLEQAGYCMTLVEGAPYQIHLGDELPVG